jgi:hypothetical protein
MNIQDVRGILLSHTIVADSPGITATSWLLHRIYKPVCDQQRRGVVFTVLPWMKGIPNSCAARLMNIRQFPRKTQSGILPPFSERAYNVVYSASTESRFVPPPLIMYSGFRSYEISKASCELSKLRSAQVEQRGCSTTNTMILTHVGR